MHYTQSLGLACLCFVLALGLLGALIGLSLPQLIQVFLTLSLFIAGIGFLFHHLDEVERNARENR